MAKRPTEQTVYLNGGYCAASEAAVSPFDRGFQYGEGMFETLLVRDGAVLRAEDHLDRMYKGLQLIGAPLPLVPDDVRTIAGRLARKNGLLTGEGRLKIIVTRGVARDTPPWRVPEPTVFLDLAPYDRSALPADWSLLAEPGVQASPHAGMKSLNYLGARLALDRAQVFGHHDAITFNAAGHVCETGTASLLARLEGAWIIPDAPEQLQGIGRKTVARMLRARGLRVERGTLTLDGLHGAEALWALNALMGIMPVRRVGDRDLAAPGEDLVALAAELQAAFLNPVEAA
jgi:branched-subunit amino acid aminotransferase/4-amino-4-deoxychorismate lyase